MKGGDGGLPSVAVAPANRHDALALQDGLEQVVTGLPSPLRQAGGMLWYRALHRLRNADGFQENSFKVLKAGYVCGGRGLRPTCVLKLCRYAIHIIDSPNPYAPWMTRSM